VLVFAIGSLAVAALWSATHPTGHDDHATVLAAFERLQALEAERDQELIALRYGLSRNLDRLRALGDRGRPSWTALVSAADALDAADARRMERALQELRDHEGRKAEAIEDFVSANALLGNALRALPKTTRMLLDAAGEELDTRLAHDLDALQGVVYRFSLTGDRALREHGEEALLELEQRLPQLPDGQAGDLQTVLFHARYVLREQVAIDADLREIRALDVPLAHEGALAAYLRGFGTIQLRAARTRLLLGAVCLLLLACIGLAAARIERLNASIERTVQERTKELQSSREQYRTLVETTSAVPWQWDDERRVFTYVGPQAGDILGCEAGAWLEPGYWESRGHPDELGPVRARFEALKDGVGPIELEFRLKRDDGQWIWIRSIAHGRHARDGDSVSGFMMDITERRRLEFELQQAQKLESIGRLAAGVAHEINTPVQFVSDSVHFLRDACQDLTEFVGKLRAIERGVVEGRAAEELSAAVADAERWEADIDVEYLIENVRPAIDRSLEGLERITTIVRSMKEFAHPDQKEMCHADLNRAIESTLTIAHNEYKYVAVVERDLGEIPKVLCHLGDVNQAVLNIVVNAAHAISDAVEGTQNKGMIWVRTQLAGESVVIAIADTGNGIPKEIRDRIFDPFFTTKGVGRGTGQGLAIARSVIVDKHGGTLTVESETGKGTTFLISLPVAGVQGSREAA
jgi:PAS domain S-box-containing protein